jgi:large repetitive protein
VFTVTLSAPSALPVTVGYSTSDITAVAGTDYTATSGTLTFAPGVTSRTVTVASIADVLDEDNETIALTLNSPNGATLNDAQGIGTITDDDTAALTMFDISTTEGDSGSTTTTFVVSLSTPSSRDVTVNFTTTNISGGATAGSDFVASSGTLTFLAGSNTPQSVTVDVLGDLVDEPDQPFSLTLSGAVNAVIGRAVARATIVDNDAAPSVSISDVAISEGNSGTKALNFTLILSAPSEIRSRVQYQTADGTASAGSDYVAKTGEVVFEPGITTRTVSIVINGDVSLESAETLFVNLHTPTSLTIGDSQAVGTIQNDD